MTYDNGIYISDDECFIYCFQCAHFDSTDSWCMICDQPTEDYDFCSIRELAELEDRCMEREEVMDWEAHRRLISETEERGTCIQTT